jgi:heme a synthase
MKNNKSVIYWLLSGCILLFIMVTVGGITRLTNSGLSMTDWHLVTDTFPPLTETKWQQTFEQYKKFPEYQKINIHNNFQLSDLYIFGNGFTDLLVVSLGWFLLFRFYIF